MLDLFVARFPPYPSDAGTGKNDPDAVSFARKVAAGLLASQKLPSLEDPVIQQSPRTPIERVRKFHGSARRRSS
jgi:hypothetical protein